MKKVFILIYLLLVLSTLGFSQTLPSGVRLKDIGNQVKIGTANPTANTTVCNREFNLTTSLWYPAWGGWNGVGSYDFTNLNNSVNWSESNGKLSTMHMFVGQDLYLPDWFKMEPILIQQWTIC